MSPHTPTTSSAPFNPSKEQTHFDSAPSSHLHDYFNKQAKEYEAKAGDVTRSIARKAVGYLGELGPDVRFPSHPFPNYYDISYVIARRFPPRVSR